MKEQIKKVEEFQRVFGITNNYSPCLIGDKGYELRYNLALEELDEYLEACIKEDKIGILDALVDQMYILKGTILRHGMQNIFDAAFEEVHQSNMSKLEDGKVLTRADGKVIKGKNYRKPELAKFIYE